MEYLFERGRDESNSCEIQSANGTTFVQIVYTPLETSYLYYIDTTLYMNHKLFTEKSICKFQPHVINPLATELFFFILAHPIYKIWIIQEPNKLALRNKLHFEEKKTEYRACLKYSEPIFIE